MLTVDQARSKFIESVEHQRQTEHIELADALLRISEADVNSKINVPPMDNSAMDGFAVNSNDLMKVPITLPVSQRIPAGGSPVQLEAGSAARIFTGGMMPKAADSVVIQENCRFEADADSVVILQKTKSGENVRPQGQDISSGQIIVGAGQKLTSVDLGLLASIGLTQLKVYKKIKVAVFSTGNELAEPGEQLREGQIYNSNRTMLSAVCRQLGYEVVDCGIVEDTLDATKKALSAAALQADVIVSSGGVSVGEEDHIKPALEELGELQHWRVKMKPGKPVVLGSIDGTPFLGLPGNPVSSFIVFLLLGAPLLRSMQGQTKGRSLSFKIKAGFDKQQSSREEYIRARIIHDSDGEQIVELFNNLSSGVLTSLSWADGLVRQMAGQSIEAGMPVEFLPIRDGLF